jgi:hypothetical protein
MRTDIAKCNGDLGDKPCPQREACQRFDPSPIPNPRQVWVIPWAVRGKCTTYEPREDL